MLVDLQILKEKFGTDKARLKEIFTATEGADLAHRKKWENRIESRIHDGVLWGIKNYQFYYAADLAWDSNIINKDLLPLSLYAQGKIKIADLADQLKDIPQETRDKFVTKDASGKAIGVSIPEFHKVSVNLVRSLITKRTAALVARYAKLDPLFKYEALSTSYVAKLRADVLSQRVEMISNGYNYRHDLGQAIRETLLYSHTIEFPCSAWDKQRSVRKKLRAEGNDTSADSNYETEAYIAREGIIYRRPHPTRVFVDKAHPAATLNSDTGVTYVGYWNIVPFRDVGENPHYFNRSKIEYDTSFATSLVGQKNYWAVYSSGSPINFPGLPKDGDLPGANERDKNAGIYSTGGDSGTLKTDGDTSLLLTEYFEKVIPADVGWGSYPYPVWVRLVVAADHNVVFAEPIPYTPATYWEYNCADNKILNNAFAHDALPFQDQLSNMLTQLLHAQKAALIKVIMLDIDQIPNEEMLKKIREIIGGDAIYTHPLLIEHKGVQSAEMGVDPRKVIDLAETQALADPTMYFRSILQLLALAERILGTSANESAQSEPREISATESATIAGSVSTSLSYMGQGIDEGVFAKKRQLYEAFMALGESRVQVPVANRYLPRTIKAAGFEVVTEDQEEGATENYSDPVPKRVNVMGSKQALEYAYFFGHRDGSERPISAKSAEILVQMLQPLAQTGALEKAGAEQLYGLLNAIIRMSGAGVDFQFETKEGDNDMLPGDPKEELDGIVQQLLAALEQTNARLDQAGIPAVGAPPAAASPAAA